MCLNTHICIYMLVHTYMCTHMHACTHTHMHTLTAFCLVQLISSNLSEFPTLIHLFLASLLSGGILSFSSHHHVPVLSLSYHSSSCWRHAASTFVAAHTVAAAGLVMEKNCPVGWENGRQRTRIMKLKVILPTGGHFSQLRGNSLPL